MMRQVPRGYWQCIECGTEYQYIDEAPYGVRRLTPVDVGDVCEQCVAREREEKRELLGPEL